MRTISILVLSVVTLTGCASLQYAGNASYSVRPFIGTNGEQICCQVDVRNGKEIAFLEAHIAKSGDDFTVDLKEQGVAAFQGQAISAGATQAAIKSAAEAAAAAALAPVLPLLVPAAGAALATPGIGAAAVGAGAVIGVQKIKGANQ